MKTWLTLLLLSILFTGCNSGLQTTVTENDTSAQKVLTTKDSSVEEKQTYTILKSGQYPEFTAGEKETTIYHSDVAEDVEAFEKAYISLTDEIAPRFEGTIIIAKMGQKSTGGYSLKVEDVKDTGRYMEVTLVSGSPSGLATMALTNPYIIVHLFDNYKDVKIFDK